MKRALKVTLIIFLLLAIVVVGMWLRARRTATQQGMAAPSFRAFLTRDTASTGSSPTNPGGTLSPDQPSAPTPSEQGTTPANNTGSSITVSQFTSGPLTPAENVSSPSQSQSGSSTGSSSSNTSGSSGTGSSTTTGSSTVGTTTGTSSASCSDAEVTIAFTADELKRLGELQNEFLAISGSLHTDGDVQAELANYTTFKAKSDQAVELYNYCQAVSPRIQSPVSYTRRVGTPFWRVGTADVAGYITGGTISSATPSDEIDPRNVVSTQRILEYYFKLDLW